MVTGLSGLFLFVVTRARGMQLPGIQYVRGIWPGTRAILSYMHHNVYCCMFMIVKELGRPGPHPPQRQMASGGQGGVPLQLRTNFFELNFHC